MSVIVAAIPSQACKCCDEPLNTEFAHYDSDLKGVACMECHMRLELARQWLKMARIRNCIQVSNGKPLRSAR